MKNKQGKGYRLGWVMLCATVCWARATTSPLQQISQVSYLGARGRAEWGEKTGCAIEAVLTPSTALLPCRKAKTQDRFSQRVSISTHIKLQSPGISSGWLWLHPSAEVLRLWWEWRAREQRHASLHKPILLDFLVQYVLPIIRRLKAGDCTIRMMQALKKKN